MKAILSFNFPGELSNSRGFYVSIGGSQTSVEGYDRLIKMFWFSLFIFLLKTDLSLAFAWLNLWIDLELTSHFII